MKRFFALLVTLCAALVWYGSPSMDQEFMEDDEMAERFRRAEGL